MNLRIVRDPLSRMDLESIAARQFGDIVKAVVDVERRVMAIGGDLHSDEEAELLEDGSRQTDLWGINLYPAESTDAWIEFDSVITIRPSKGNRSRGVEDAAVRRRVREIVTALVRG